ncbi:MAG: helix-turn-helix transcriptional regulator [Christensenellales bacterium]|jgi:transcriptional regulator with XRE-family HTH domain
MTHIGNIIKECRCKAGLSQKELAERICSPKYIYYIEKGERTPSTELLRLISDKLNTDLCSLYQFLDCVHPLEVRNTIMLFEKYKRNSDFSNLTKLTERVKNKPDFTRAPWSYEIDINHYCPIVLVEGKADQAVDGLKATIQSLLATGYLDYHLAQLNILLSICYHILKDWNNCEKTAQSTLDLIKYKGDMFQYKHVIVTTKLTLLFLYIETGRFDETIQQGLVLLDYQMKHNLYERLHYTYFLLALAYYRLDRPEDAVSFCKKSLHIAMVHERVYDVGIFLAHDTFIELINHDLIDRRLVAEFCKTYQICIKQHKINL